MAGIDPSKYQDYAQGKISYEQAQTGYKGPTTQVSNPTNIFDSYLNSQTKQSAPTPSYYSGPATTIGNVNNSQDLFKSYQGIYDQVRTQDPTRNQINTWSDKTGNVYDTTKMTPQQIFAMSLAKDGNPNAAAVLKGMGLDMNGNPTSPTPVYSPPPPGAKNSWEVTTPIGGTGGSSGLHTLPGNPNEKPQFQTLPGNPNEKSQPQLLSAVISSPKVQTGTLTPNVPYTKNPDVDKKSMDEQLAYYAQNPQEAMQEIQRAKGIFDDPNSTEQQKADAHAWAVQMRQATGVSEDNPQYGSIDPANPTPSGGGSTVPPATGGAGTGVGAGTGTGAGAGAGYPGTANLGDAGKIVQGNDAFTQQLIKALTDSQNNMFDRNSVAAQQQQALAQQQAQLIVNQKLAQYQNLMGSLQTGQQNDLQAIAGSVENAKNSIEDKSFQDWLGARQDAASRGLGSSGIAGDANTRLLLAKQHDLANMYTQKQTASNDVNKNYADKLNAARLEVANTNVPQTAAELFNKMFSDTSSKYSEQSKMFADLLGKQLGYSQINPKDALDYQAINNQTAGRYEAAIAKLNSTAQIEYAKMAQKYQTDMTKIMGVDSNGNLTVDAKTLMETIRHNGATESITASHNAATTAIAQMNANISAGNLQVNRDRLTDTINHNVAQLKLDTAKFKDSHTAGQAKVLYDAAQTAQGEANSAIKMKSDYMMNNYNNTNTQEYKDKLDGYDKAIIDATKKIDDASSAMQEVSGLYSSGVFDSSVGANQ